jgi:phenylacetate-CoA ligase
VDANNTLLFTGENGVPLIRYHINDNGGVVSYDNMLKFLREHGFDPLAKLSPRGLYKMPFVFVFGR